MHLPSTDLPGRRRFLGRCVVAGAGLCLGAPLAAEALSSHSGVSGRRSGAVHKFDADSAMTYKAVFRFAFVKSFIPTMTVMAEMYGLEAVQQAAEEAVERLVREAAGRWLGRDLSVIADRFKHLGPLADHALTFDIVEDTESAFGMRVTECLWAEIFREANAADLGYSCVCRTDFAMARAFNPEIELQRSKTLMQGHDGCNHRYVVRREPDWRISLGMIDRGA